MAEESKEVLQVRKAVNEAGKGLKGLERDLKAVVKMFEKGTLTPSKAKAAARKVTSFMGKQVPVTKLQNAPVFDRLPPDAQRDVMWLDGVVNACNNWLGRLDDALKLSKKDPEKDYTILVKAARRYGMVVERPPKGVGTLLKQVKQGMDAHTAAGAGIALLPLVILFWMMFMTISRGLKDRK